MSLEKSNESLKFRNIVVGCLFNVEALA